MNSKENRFLLDSKYQLALQHATIPISIFGFNTLDEDEWRNNTLEYMTTPILNKRKPTSIGKELTETNTSELRRIRGLPSSLRAIIPSENQKLIVETIVSNEPRKQGLKSSQYYRNNRDGDALYDIPNSARRYYTEPDPEESPPKRASSARNSRRMNDSQKVDSQSKVNNNPRTVRATNSPERKDLTTPKSPIPIRRGVDGSPLFMTPIKKTKLALEQELQESLRKRQEQEKRKKLFNRNTHITDDQGNECVYDYRGYLIPRHEYQPPKKVRNISDEDDSQEGSEQAYNQRREEPYRRPASASILTKTKKFVEYIRNLRAAEANADEIPIESWQPAKLPASTVAPIRLEESWDVASPPPKKDVLPQEAARKWPEYFHLKPLDVILTIEHCCCCHEHNEVTHHNESKYLSIAKTVHESMILVAQQYDIRYFSIIKPIDQGDQLEASKNRRNTPTDKGLKFTQPTGKALVCVDYSNRIGAMEIQLAVKLQNQLVCHLLHSKLFSGQWPKLWTLQCLFEEVLELLGFEKVAKMDTPSWAKTPMKKKTPEKAKSVKKAPPLPPLEQVFDYRNRRVSNTQIEENAKEGSFPRELSVEMREVVSVEDNIGDIYLDHFDDRSTGMAPSTTLESVNDKGLFSPELENFYSAENGQHTNDMPNYSSNQKTHPSLIDQETKSISAYGNLFESAQTNNKLAVNSATVALAATNRQQQGEREEVITHSVPLVEGPLLGIFHPPTSPPKSISDAIIKSDDPIQQTAPEQNTTPKLSFLKVDDFQKGPTLFSLSPKPLLPDSLSTPDDLAISLPAFNDVHRKTQSFKITRKEPENSSPYSDLIRQFEEELAFVTISPVSQSKPMFTFSAPPNSSPPIAKALNGFPREDPGFFPSVTEKLDFNRNVIEQNGSLLGDLQTTAEEKEGNWLTNTNVSVASNLANKKALQLSGTVSSKSFTDARQQLQASSVSNSEPSIAQNLQAPALSVSSERAVVADLSQVNSHITADNLSDTNKGINAESQSSGQVKAPATDAHDVVAKNVEDVGQSTLIPSESQIVVPPSVPMKSNPIESSSFILPPATDSVSKLEGRKASTRPTNHLSAKDTEKLVKSYGFMCAYCELQGEVSDFKLDFIIPLDDGGDCSFTNFQPLCADCYSIANPGSDHSQDVVDSLDPTNYDDLMGNSNFDPQPSEEKIETVSLSALLEIQEGDNVNVAAQPSISENALGGSKVADWTTHEDEKGALNASAAESLPPSGIEIEGAEIIVSASMNPILNYIKSDVLDNIESVPLPFEAVVHSSEYHRSSPRRTETALSIALPMVQKSILTSITNDSEGYSDFSSNKLLQPINDNDNFASAEKSQSQAHLGPVVNNNSTPIVDEREIKIDANMPSLKEPSNSKLESHPSAEGSKHKSLFFSSIGDAEISLNDKKSSLIDDYDINEEINLEIPDLITSSRSFTPSPDLLSGDRSSPALAQKPASKLKDILRLNASKLSVLKSNLSKITLDDDDSSGSDGGKYTKKTKKSEDDFWNDLVKRMDDD